MVIKNKKNGTNVLAYKEGAHFVRFPMKAKETVNISNLIDFDDIINKQDFGPRGWFEIVTEKVVSVKKDSALEKAKKEVKEYTSEEENKENN
jgi:hypothetical protein